MNEFTECVGLSSHCCSEAEQPYQVKGKGSQFNLTDLQDMGKITSINSQETGKDSGVVDVYHVGVETKRKTKTCVGLCVCVLPDA